MSQFQARRVIAALAGAAIALSACGGSSSSTGPSDLTGAPNYSGSLSILTKFGVATLSPFFQDVAAAYTKLHPNVKIDLIQETDESMKDKEKTLTASQALPDIFFSWTGNWGENFVNGGIAADLTSVIGPGTAWGSTFAKSALDAFSWGGKYYAVPLYVDAKFMGYNKKIFSDLGLGVPTTFEELIKDCGVIKATGIEPISFGNKDGWPAIHYTEQLFAYNVPWDVLSADWTPSTAKLDDPGYAKSLTEFKQLVDNCTSTGAGSNGVLYSTALQAASDARAAMYYQEILEFDQSNAEGSALRNDGFGFFQLPVPADATGDPKALEGAPEGYMINSKSKNAALAVDFLKFVTNQENAVVLTKQYGQPSAVVGAVNDQTASVALKAGVDQLDAASRLVIWLDTVTVPSVADAWLSSTEGLISGDKTPEAVMETMRKASSDAK